MAFRPIIDEVHDVNFVDGIHLGRCAVVLIAQTPDHVLGWYAARSENSRAWGAHMSRIVPRPWSSLTGAAGSGAGFCRLLPPPLFSLLPLLSLFKTCCGVPG